MWDIIVAIFMPILLLILIGFILLIEVALLVESVEKKPAFPRLASLISPLYAMRAIYGNELGEGDIRYILKKGFLFLYFFAVINLFLYMDIPILGGIGKWFLFVPFLCFVLFSRIWVWGLLTLWISEEKTLEKLVLEQEKMANRIEPLYKEVMEMKNLLMQKYEHYKDRNTLLHELEYDLEDLRMDMEDEKKRIQQIYQTVEENLRSIHELPMEVQVAIDTNVLMEWDDYLLDALRERSILISKRVQRELDQNKTKEDPKVEYKARRGIRYLLSLPAESYRFVNGDWNERLLKENGLSSQWEDEKILADYLTCKLKGQQICIASSDANFLISAKPLFPILGIKNPKIFR